MDHFAGLDVSVKETSICIVDDTGRIVREVKVASEPDALLQVLENLIYRFKRIGLEAGPLSQWLFSALAEAGLLVICVETGHMRGSASASRRSVARNPTTIATSKHHAGKTEIVQSFRCNRSPAHQLVHLFTNIEFAVILYEVDLLLRSPK